MSVRTTWESFKIEGNQLLDKIKEILAEGNARRIVITQDGRKVVEFPLTVGLAAAFLAPIMAAVAGLATLLTNCTVEVERAVPDKAEEPVKVAKPKKATKAKRRRA